MNAVLGIIRHILTAAGGSLVTNGTLSDGDLQTGIGALVTVIGIAWSIWDKKKSTAQ